MKVDVQESTLLQQLADERHARECEKCMFMRRALADCDFERWQQYLQHEEIESRYQQERVRYFCLVLSDTVLIIPPVASSIQDTNMELAALKMKFKKKG